MVVNLISPKGERVSVKVSFPFILNRNKVRRMMERGYTLETEADADIVYKLGII